MIILIISKLNGYFWLRGPDKILLLSTSIIYSNSKVIIIFESIYFSPIEEAQQLLYFLMSLRSKLAHLWDNVLAIPSLFTVGVPLSRHLSCYGVAVGQGKMIYSLKDLI